MTPYQARDELRGLLLGTAAAVAPDREAVLAFDPGPTGAGALCDGAAATVTSLVRVEVPADRDTERPLATARHHLTRHGWSVVRSGTSAEAAELVAVRDGYTISVTRRGTEHRLVLTGETPPLPG